MSDITNEELYAEKKDTIPYYVHEGIMARMERHTRRLWALCIIIFAAFVGTNLAWFLYESQFEEVVTTQTVTQESQSDGDGDAIINGTYAGAIINGESETDDYENN